MKNPKRTSPQRTALPATQQAAGPMENNWLDNVDLLKIFHLSPRTLLRWRQTGLPFHKLGRKIFYEKNDVEQFLRRY